MNNRAGGWAQVDVGRPVKGNCRYPDENGRAWTHGVEGNGDKYMGLGMFRRQKMKWDLVVI